MEIEFLGAAGTVTGSKYLLTSNQTKVLVDCGLFQGIKSLRQQNWKSLPVNPSEISAVILTHAHLDHSGYIPLLVKQGYRGPIYCTAPTVDLCKILLPDSGRISEEDAEYANRKKFSKHEPALALYTEEDALNSLKYFKAVELAEPLIVGDLTITFQSAGHILGASSVLVKNPETSVVFSGDLGRYDDPIEPQPTAPPVANWVVMESTYGDRNHASDDREAVLAALVKKVVKRKGVMIIPAFAVGRVQGMLYNLGKIFEKHLAPRVPIYINSPMATNVTHLYSKHSAWHNLGRAEYEKICNYATFINSVEESKALNRKDGPMIIISASGMLTGGRVLHHIAKFAPDPNNMILLSGFQAPGTRGWTLASGANKLKFHGKYIDILAEVIQLDHFSAHGDQSDLLRWLRSSLTPPKNVILVHGEPAASDQLRLRIKDTMESNVHIAAYMETLKLS